MCGTPFRVFWPYVKDPVSAARLREDAVFEVSACWNGMVAFPADNYLYRPDGISSAPRAPPTRRGWEMVDNGEPVSSTPLTSATFPHAKASPPLTQPLKFRTSGIDSCDHSECFLFSYDLHRLFTDRRPRILMNPRVLTTYDPKWWTWNNVVLRVPVVKWWRCACGMRVGGRADSRLLVPWCRVLDHRLAGRVLSAQARLLHLGGDGEPSARAVSCAAWRDGAQVEHGGVGDVVIDLDCIMGGVYHVMYVCY